MAAKAWGAGGSSTGSLRGSGFQAATVFVAWAGVLLMALSASLGQETGSVKPTILEFSRLACPVCAKVEAALQELQARYGQEVEVRILHIDRDEPLFKEYGISVVPTQIFLDPSGKEVARNEGYISLEQLVKRLKELRFIRD